MYKVLQNFYQIAKYCSVKATNFFYVLYIFILNENDFKNLHKIGNVRAQNKYLLLLILISNYEYIKFMAYFSQFWFIILFNLFTVNMEKKELPSSSGKKCKEPVPSASGARKRFKSGDDLTNKVCKMS